jgi:hypothetical protein
MVCPLGTTKLHAYVILGPAGQQGPAGKQGARGLTGKHGEKGDSAPQTQELSETQEFSVPDYMNMTIPTVSTSMRPLTEHIKTKKEEATRHQPALDELCEVVGCERCQHA